MQNQGKEEQKKHLSYIFSDKIIDFWLSGSGESELRYRNNYALPKAYVSWLVFCQTILVP